MKYSSLGGREMNKWASIIWDGEKISAVYVRGLWDLILPEDEIIWH